MNTKNKKIWIFLFTIPCMILFALVYAAPIITVFYTSLCDYTAFNSPAFQGIKNFITIFSDSDFICSIRNTLLWVVLQSTIHVGVGLAMALVLRRKPKGWKSTPGWHRTARRCRAPPRVRSAGRPPRRRTAAASVRSARREPAPSSPRSRGRP